MNFMREFLGESREFLGKTTCKMRELAEYCRVLDYFLGNQIFSQGKKPNPLESIYLPKNQSIFPGSNYFYPYLSQTQAHML